MALAEATEKFRDSIRRAGLAPARAQCGIGRDKPRGFGLSKEKQSVKNDGAVAFSVAIIASEHCGAPADIDLEFTNGIKFSLIDRWIDREAATCVRMKTIRRYNCASRCV